MEILLKKYLEFNDINSMNQNWFHANKGTFINYQEGNDFFIHVDKIDYPYIRTMPRKFLNHDGKTPAKNCKIFIEKLIELNNKI